MATLPAMLASPRGIPRLCGLLGLSLRVNRAPTRGIVGCAVTIAVGIAELSDTANKEGHRVEKGSASASGSVMQLVEAWGLHYRTNLQVRALFALSDIDRSRSRYHAPAVIGCPRFSLSACLITSRVGTTGYPDRGYDAPRVHQQVASLHVDGALSIAAAL